jgi:cell wall-associated NlpC family hydrolase
VKEVQKEPTADSIVDIAKAQLGVTYKYATSNPGVSFDCSGFTAYVYGSLNITDCRSSKSYATIGEKIELSEVRKGDCLVFSGTAPGSTTAGHVGIVIENNENGIQFIHCSSSKSHYGVVITHYESSGYPQRFLQARRLF